MHESPTEAAAAKAALRARVRAGRRARTPTARADAAADLAVRALEAGPLLPLLAAGARVALYEARGGEPGTAPLAAALAAAGIEVLVPVVSASASGGPLPLGWVGAAGEDAALDGVVAVLAPALAVDACGTRLGQGGGHYDTTLAAAGWSGRARPLFAVVVHDEEVLPAGSVPREPHDVPADAALTPSGWVVLGR